MPLTGLRPFFFLCCLILIAGSLKGQQGIGAIETHEYGYNRADYASSVITNFAGDPVFVGSAVIPRGAGVDILLGILNEGVVKPIIHGGPRDEKANDIIQLTDGRYLVVGNTTFTGSTTNQEREAALLLLLSRDGQRVLNDTTIRDEITSSTFSALCRDNQNNVYITGQKDSEIWIVKYEPDGEIVWNFTFSKGGLATGTDIVMLPNGEVAVVGYSDKQGIYTGHYLRFTPEGQLIESVDYKGDRFSGMVVLSNTKELVVTGMAEEERGDLLFLKIKTTGEVVSRNAHHGPYHYSNEDYGTSVWQDINGNVHIVGANSSEQRGMSRSKGWYTIFDEEGSLVASELIGGKSEDVLYSLYPLSKNSVAAVGHTSSGKGLGKEAWLLKVSLDSAEASTSPMVSCISANYKDDDGDGLLTFGEKSVIEFTFVNKATAQSTEIKLEPVTLAGAAAITASPLCIPHIAPESTVSGIIEVSLPEEASSGISRLSFQSGNVDMEKCPVEVPTGESPQPKLIFSNITVADGANNLIKGDTSLLSLTLINSGNLLLTDVELRYVVPENVTLLKPFLNKEEIAVGENLEWKLACVVGPNFLSDSLRLEVVATGSDNVFAKNYFTTAVETPKLPAPAPVIERKEFISVNWLVPNRELVKVGNVTVKDAYVTLEALVVSSAPINDADVQLYINNTQIERGQKFRNVSLLARETESQQQREFTYDLVVQELQLSIGENVVVVKVDNTDVEYSTTPFVFNFTPQKPNLHLLSIGVPYSDLKYTTKDATDIQTAFQEQEGLMYERVFSRLLVKPEETKAPELKKAFIDIENDYRSGKILDRDVVALFISSHGDLDPNTNRLKLEDSSSERQRAKYRYRDITTIDYQEDIIERLKTLQCKVIILIDACHSGGIQNVDAGLSAKSGDQPLDAELSRALISLIDASPGIRAIASCQSDEKSWEDPEWENGAFSKAIVEAFENEPVTVLGRETTSASVDDNIVTLNEFYSFISKRVPYLVLRKSKGKKSQVPYISYKHLEYDFSLFFLKKE